MRILGWPAFDPRNKNPYNRLLYEALHAADPEMDVTDFSSPATLLDSPQVWHMHWPERAAQGPRLLGALGRAVAFVVLVKFAKRRRTRIVWTVHNLRGHDPAFPRLERTVLQWLSRQVDGFVSLSDYGLGLTLDEYPALRGRSHVVVPHGHFIGVYPSAVLRAEARKTLQVPASDRVLLFLGRVAGYKNVPTLVRRFKQLDDAALRLVIAGEPTTRALKSEIEVESDSDRRIQLHLEHVRDDELQMFLRAADLVVLPFADILNSSSVLLALSFGIPVLVPHTGAMVELARDLGSFWVRTYEPPLRPVDLARAAGNTAVDPVEGARLEELLLSAYDWSDAGRLTAGFYRRVVGGLA
jgi:beta-1,4-mannosyltransferase